MRQKTSLIVLTLLLSSTKATQVNEKSTDFQTTNLGNKISNMAFMMMNSQNSHDSRPDQVEMLALDSDTTNKLDKGGLDSEEITDLMKETFAQKKEEEPTVGEILAEEDNKEKQAEEGNKKEEEKAPEVSQEDTMSFTEQLELAKKQSEEEEKKAKKAEEDKKKQAKIKAEKEEQRKKKLAEEKAKKAKQQEDDLGDPFDEKANLTPAEEKQKNMLDEISKAESNQGAKAPKDGEEDVDDKKEEDQKKPKKEEHFKDADEALDSFGKRLAEHQLQMTGGASSDEEEKPKPKKKEAKKTEKKSEKNADFDDDELKAIDKIKMGDEKPKSFKEYQMEQAQEELNSQEEEKPKSDSKKPENLMKAILAKHKKEAAKKEASSSEPAPAEDTNVQKSTDIHLKMPKIKIKPIPKKKNVDLKSLIKAKNAKKAPAPAPVEESAALPQIAEPAPAPTPAPAPEKKISEMTQKKIQAQFKKELESKGDKAPSDITEALADSSDFGDAGKQGAEPSGFVGKYLKKHRDAKLKATEAVLQEEKETKQRLIEKMNEKIAEKASPQNQLFQGTATPEAPKKFHKLTLSERTAQKFLQQQQKSSDEAKAGQGIAMEVQQLTQVDDQQSTADEIVAQVFGKKDD